MKITAITTQIKQANRYSIFVDNKFAFSLSQNALLESKIKSGQEITRAELIKLKEASNDDKLYMRALALVSARPKTVWEVEFYLKQKDASPALIKTILNKLSNIGLLDDLAYAKKFVESRQDYRPASKRKIIAELKKRRISEDVMREAMTDSSDDQTALKKIIEIKKRQTKYKDKQKLMQYLARQGFNYEDIKSALN